MRATAGSEQPTWAHYLDPMMEIWTWSRQEIRAVGFCALLEGTHSKILQVIAQQKAVSVDIINDGEWVP